MKKMIIPMLAVILAVAGSAFTYQPAPDADQIYDWRVFNNGSPTSQYLNDLTEAEVRDMHPSCNGSLVTCFQAYDAATRTSPQPIFIKKN